MNSQNDELKRNCGKLLHDVSDKLGKFEIDVGGKFSNSESLKAFSKYFSSIQSVIDNGLKMNVVTDIDNIRKSFNSLENGCKVSLDKYKSDNMNGFDKNVRDESSFRLRTIKNFEDRIFDGCDASTYYKASMNVVLQDRKLSVKEAENRTVEDMLKYGRFAVNEIKSALSSCSPNCVENGWKRADTLVDAIKNKIDVGIQSSVASLDNKSHVRQSEKNNDMSR